MGSTWGQFTATTAPQQMVPGNLSRQAILLKAFKTNTDRCFLLFFSSNTVLSASNGMPIEPGESIMIATDYANQRCADLGGPISVLANSATQVIAWVDFSF
jgi:hypothetical protein